MRLALLKSVYISSQLTLCLLCVEGKRRESTTEKIVEYNDCDGGGKNVRNVTPA